MNSRRSFSRAFKLEAVRKVTQQGLSVASVARELDVRTSMIHKWKWDFQDQQLPAARPTDDPSLTAELIRLREENRQLKMERDILKKATAYFARQST